MVVEPVPQDPLQLVLVAVSELVEESAFVGHVIGEGHVDPAPTFAGQLHEGRATVADAGLDPLDETPRLQAVQPLADAARRHHRRARQVGRPKGVRRPGAAQCRQDVEVDLSEAVLLVDPSQLSGQRSGEPVQPTDHPLRRDIHVRALSAPLGLDRIDVVRRVLARVHRTTISLPWKRIVASMEAKSTAAVTAIGAIAPLVWGTTYVVTTELLPPHHPMTAAVLRAVPAGLLLIAITRAWPRAWVRLIVLSALNIGLFFPLLFVAAYRLPGGLAAVVGAGQPFVVAVAAGLLLRQRTPVRQLAWAALAVGGVATAMLTGEVTLDAIGVLAATGGTVAMALGITLTRSWGATAGLSGLASTGWQLLLGGLMILPLVPVIDHGPFVLDRAAVLGYAWLSLIGAALAYSVWFHAARRLPATSTSMLAVLSPVAAAALGWAVLDQNFTTIQVVGFVVALTASVLGQARPDVSGEGRACNPDLSARAMGSTHGRG